MNPMSFLRMCEIAYQEMPMSQRVKHWQKAYDIVKEVERVVEKHMWAACDDRLDLQIDDYDRKALYHLVKKHDWVKTIYIADSNVGNFSVAVHSPKYPVKPDFENTSPQKEVPEDKIVVSRQGEEYVED